MSDFKDKNVLILGGRRSGAKIVVYRRGLIPWRM